MKKLKREDLYKLIYIAAEGTCIDDGMYGITSIGKKNEGIGFKENLSFKNLSKKERDTYIKLVKEQVFKDKKSITTGNQTRMSFKAKSVQSKIKEYANYNFYNELINYYNDEEYLKDFEKDHEELLPFVQEELEKHNDEFYEKYQAMEEKEYDFEQEFEEEEEEINELEELKNKIKTIKQMSKEDFQRLVYMTALDVSNKSTIFNKDEKSLLEKEEDKKQTYISCAQKSALKSFSSHPDLVFSTLMGIGKDAPEELKQIITKQLLFDATYNDIFEKYRLAKDKEKFFNTCDKNFGVDISKKAIEEIDTEMSMKFFKKIEEAKQNLNHDDKIKASVVQFWLECVKQNNPNLSEENQRKFSDRLMQHINRSYDSIMGSSLSVDYDPCGELVDAYYEMDIERKFFGPEGEFPYKTSTYTEKGKYAKVSSEYKESKYLYMSPEYLEEQKKNIQEQINKEEAKIPEKIKEQWEKEYQEEISKLEEERERLKKQQEETRILKEKQDEAEEKAEQLLCSYSDRIDELESLSLSDEEKNKRKMQIIEETKSAVDKMQEEKRRIGLAQGFDKSLDDFEKQNVNIFNKKMWEEKQALNYVREQHHLRHEEWRKTHHDFSWPDTSDLPTSDLNRIYEERNLIKNYEEEQKQQGNSQIEQEENIDEGKIEALSQAYLEYATKHKSYLEDNKKQELQKRLTEYFKSNFSKLEDTKFLINFETYELEKIKEQYQIFNDSFGFRIRKEEPTIKVEEGIIYKNDILGKKIYYGESETIQRKLKEVESKIKFYKDTKDNSMKLYELEKEKQSYQDYLQKLQTKGKPVKTLLELEEEKQQLEKVEQEAKELRKQYEEQDKNKENSDVEIS